MKNYQLVLLDRDGVINHDSPNYIKSVNEWLPITGSLAAIARLNQQHIKVAVCTNQSGVGRGYFDLATLHAMHDKMQRLLQQQTGHIDAIFFCPHIPDAHCACRKPKSGMYQKALQQFVVPAEQTLVVGDAWRDIEAAQSLGCDAVLVKTGKGEKTLAAGHDLTGIGVYDDLAAVVDAISQ